MFLHGSQGSLTSAIVCILGNEVEIELRTLGRGVMLECWLDPLLGRRLRTVQGWGLSIEPLLLSFCLIRWTSGSVQGTSPFPESRCSPLPLWVSTANVISKWRNEEMTGAYHNLNMMGAWGQPELLLPPA